MKPHQPTVFFFWKNLALPLGALLVCLMLIIAIAHSLPISSNEAWKQWLLVFLGGAGILASVAACLRVGKSVAAPVAHLVDVARAITHGRKEKASGQMVGEFQVLAEALNKMIESRHQAEEKLRLAQESLEFKVRARTVELWRANKSLRAEMEQRAKAERDLQQVQKMDSLGRFAGAIAHDFNNLLTVILGGTECAMQQLHKDHPALEFLRPVWKAGESAAELTRPLLTFSRSEVMAVQPLDLNESVDDAVSLIKRLIGINIEVRLFLSPGLPTVINNANQLQQIIVNLAVNARDAMNGKGTLTISTARVAVDPASAALHEVTEGANWLALSVADSGCGMDAETKARIFEPFFTTKPAGRGTGLGLATVFGIVKQAGGFIDVESTVGVGTTFRIFLPGSDQAVPLASSTPLGAIKPARVGGETLLVVEDEEDIRDLAQLMLEESGYKVICAPDAEQAILLAQQHRNEIKALVTDVVMPRVSGVQLAELLMPIMPNLKVLFVSGHCRESVSLETESLHKADYLQKPYHSQNLIDKIQNLLAQVAPEPVPAPVASVPVEIIPASEPVVAAPMPEAAPIPASIPKPRSAPQPPPAPAPKPAAPAPRVAPPEPVPAVAAAAIPDNTPLVTYTPMPKSIPKPRETLF